MTNRFTLYDINCILSLLSLQTIYKTLITLELKMVIPATVVTIPINWFQLFRRSVQWNALVMLMKFAEVHIE